MADEYSKSLLRIALAQICQNVGFNGVTTTSFDVLLDLLRRHLQCLCENARTFTDHFGRNEPVLDDLGLVFTEMGISANELMDYLSQTTPITFPRKVSQFPVKRPNKLNLPKPDCAELKTRPDHIPRYLPPMQPEKVEEPPPNPAPGAAETAKINSARVNTRRSTLQQKSEQLNCDDWLSDLYDFDAVKAGLVKIVPVSPPAPPPPPTPPQPPPTAPAAPKITIVDMAPVNSEPTPPPLKISTQKSGGHGKHAKSHATFVSEEKLTVPKPVLKDLNASSSFSEHSNDTSIEECISSVVEQAQQSKNNEHPQISPVKYLPPPVYETVKITKQISPSPSSEVVPKTLKSAKNSAADVLNKQPSSQKQPLDLTQQKYAPVIEETKQSTSVAVDTPPVLMPTVSLEKIVPTTNDDDQQKRTQKRSEEKALIKEVKSKRKIENVISQLTPAAKRQRLPPPMPVVDTSTLFQPDAKIISTPATSTKKVAPLVLQKPKLHAEQLSLAQPATVAPPLTNQQQNASNVGRPKTPTKKLGPLKIKLSIPQPPPSSSPSPSSKPSVGKQVPKIEGKKEKIKDKKLKQQKHQMPFRKGEKVADLLKKLPRKQTVEQTSSKLTEESLKVPKLILKLPPKPSDYEKIAAEEMKPAPSASTRANFTISPNASSPDRENSIGQWSNDDDATRSGLNLRDFRSSSPPPKSPSLHSKSPSLRSLSNAANSPPPPTPSPRSLSPSSPIGIYIPDADVAVEDFGKSVESPLTKFVSPAVSHVSTTSTKYLVQEQPQQRQNEEEKVWYCPVCHIPYEEGADMIACDKCDNWFHWSCVGLTQAPPDAESWYCTNCASSKKSQKVNKIVVKKKPKKGAK